MNPLKQLSYTDRVAKRAQYEAYEFELVSDGVRVRNCSHADPAAHEYVVTVENGVPVACECPADEHYEGACKHRVAVAIRQPIVDAAAERQVRADGGEVSLESETESDSGRPGQCQCSDDPERIPCWECVRTGRRSL